MRTITASIVLVLLTSAASGETTRSLRSGAKNNNDKLKASSAASKKDSSTKTKSSKKDSSTTKKSSKKATSTSQTRLKASEAADLLQTPASFAPIPFQLGAGVGEGSNPVELLLKKYGMVSTGKKAPPPSSSAGKGAGGEQSWAYASITEGDTCSGQEYMTAGVKLNTCLAMFGSGTLLSCDGGEVAYYVYNNEECTGTPTKSDVVATVGCQQPSQPIVNEWWSFDDDIYRKSVNIQCVTTFGPPDVGRNAYDVWHVYADSTCGTTTAGGSNDYALFEAYVLDTCIPIQVFYTRTDDRSASFAYDSATQQMYAKIYNQNRDCSGAYTTVDFDAECAAGGNAVMSYQWGYDAGEKKGGKVVKSASPRPQ